MAARRVDDPKVGGEKRGRKVAAAIQIPCDGRRRVRTLFLYFVRQMTTLFRGYLLKKSGAAREGDGSWPLLLRPGEAVL